MILWSFISILLLVWFFGTTADNKTRALLMGAWFLGSAALALHNYIYLGRILA